jgi:hypothetical protein
LILAVIIGWEASKFIIALLGATGKAMYDNYKNKEETGHTNR